MRAPACSTRGASAFELMHTMTRSGRRTGFSGPCHAMEKISLEQIAGGYLQKAEDKNSNCGQNADVERRVRFCSARRRACGRGPAATTMMTRAPEFNTRLWVDLSAACASDFEVLMMWTVTGSMPPA